MEVFTDVAAESFRTGLPPFRRPTGTKSGSELCIAVTSGEGQILTALYAVLVTLLFAVCWKLLGIVVMMSLGEHLQRYIGEPGAGSGSQTPDKTRDENSHYKNILRGIALVGFWNAREPVGATGFVSGYLTQLQGVSRDKTKGIRMPAVALLMLGVVWLLATNVASILGASKLVVGDVAPANPNKVYVPKPPGTASADIMRLQALRAPATLRSLGSAEAAGNDHTMRKRVLPAVALLMLGVVWLLATNVASILGASKLVVGDVAPANPNKVYVPKPPGTASADIMRLQALRAPATLRSLGSAEAAGNDHTMRKRVLFNANIPSGDSPKYFTYKYTVKAQDMGLQKWHDLQQEVSGRCEVDSTWFWRNEEEEDLDVYRPWGLANKTVKVAYDGERKTAPSATAIPFPYADPEFLKHQAVEHQYGIIVHSSHRASHRPGTDPWYETESFTPSENDTDAQIVDPASNRVKGGRPALSCTQKDVWSYNGKQFKNIFELTDDKSLNFPDGWSTQLQLDFTRPRVIDVINSAGSSSLVSSTTFVGGRFDAETSTIEKDMIRLFTATWISSAHTFRNMLMVSQDQNIPNVARNEAGQPQAGVALFVVSTPQVATLRLTVLVVVPALLGFFTLLLSILVHCGKSTWYKRTLFAEGAYQFARAQAPGVFTDSEKMGKVVLECAKKIT
ncbi:hypothetical protein C7212DRAFT_364595 [Tuber magnatum]|uniref:Uncharacterized protein n=1 Tax=Tuber magnatum TaxID=42249 RepID=A0A317SLU0_9PEZI|nr:hypothetical protein C7212DRAFT_364595 [Tuber magnatum]